MTISTHFLCLLFFDGDATVDCVEFKDLKCRPDINYLAFLLIIIMTTMMMTAAPAPTAIATLIESGGGAGL